MFFKLPFTIIFHLLKSDFKTRGKKLEKKRIKEKEEKYEEYISFFNKYHNP